MDPNATLQRIRELQNDLSHTRSYESAAGLAAELADAVQDLDEWLKKGGYPPRDWEKPVISAYETGTKAATQHEAFDRGYILGAKHEAERRDQQFKDVR
jgi:hypothetical protein